MILILALGTTTWAHKAPRQSLTELTAALKQNPNQGHLWVHRAQLHREAGNLRAALTDCSQALNRGQNRPWVRCLRLELILELQATDQSKANLLEGLRYQSPCEGLLAARIKMARGNDQDAIDLLQERVFCFPLSEDQFLEASRLVAQIHPQTADQLIQERLSRGPHLQLFVLLLDLHEANPRIALDRLAAYGKPYSDALPVVTRHAALLARVGEKEHAVARYELALQRLDRLPAHRRQSGAFTQIESNLRRGLEELLGVTAP